MIEFIFGSDFALFNNKFGTGQLPIPSINTSSCLCFRHGYGDYAAQAAAAAAAVSSAATVDPYADGRFVVFLFLILC